MIRTFAMKELRCSSLMIIRKSVLTFLKAELTFLFLFFVFYLFIYFFLARFFFFTNIMIHRTAGKGKVIYLTPFYHFHLLHRHFDISKVFDAESSPLHIDSRRNQTRNLWFPIVKWLSTKLL